MIDISVDRIDVANSVAAFEAEVRQQGQSGAIVSFSGLVRATARGAQVSKLMLQAYSPMTEDGISAALARAQERWPLDHVQIRHRVGTMLPGDTIVFVATASAHRRAAFESADFLMDYLKTEAIFWKHETTADGAAWIEPRADDYSAAARWHAGEGS